MADIKTKDSAKGTIRTIDKAAVATQRMKQAYIATKEKAERSVNSYKASTLELVPKVLTELKNGPKEVKDLFLVMRPALADATDFLSVMDCLYALRAVDINEDGEVYSCL